jgi:hypothetical protein
MQKLTSQNIVNRTVLVQVQAELSEAQDRRQQAAIDSESAKQKLAQLERELEKHRLEVRLEVSKAASAAERDGKDAVDESVGVLDVLKSLKARDAVVDDDGSMVFEVVRQVGKDGQTLRLADTDLLQPGDLVRVRSPAAGTVLRDLASGRSERVLR